MQEAFRVGLYRMERVVRERMTTEDVDTITPQTIINIRPVVAALKEFFGSSQLSQFMDQTNSLSGLTHRRRLSALGAGGLTRERAPIEVRDVHPTHYGRMCPIETPEGPNIGLIGSLVVASRRSPSTASSVAVPPGRRRQADRRGALPGRLRGGGFIIAQANAPVDKGGKLVGPVLVRTAAGASPTRSRPRTSTSWTSHPAQLVSVSTALIPFLEHDDANRALMGSNMQRQAVPLLITEAPPSAPAWSTAPRSTPVTCMLARAAGTVVYSTPSAVGVDARRRQERPLRDGQVLPLQPGHADPPEADREARREGRGRHRPGRRLVDRQGRAGARQEPARAPSCPGRATTSRTRSSSASAWSRTTSSRPSTSTSTRWTRGPRSSATRRSRATSRTARRSRCANLDDRGIVRIGAEVGSGDLLVGKVTPKGETELTAEEKLIRAIFKEKAREVRDTSLKVPHGEGGKVIDVKIFRREAGDELTPASTSSCACTSPRSARSPRATSSPAGTATRASSRRSSPRRTCRSWRTARPSTSSSTRSACRAA